MSRRKGIGIRPHTPSCFNLEQWVISHLQPTLMVFASQAVEDVCGKNNLNTVQMLQPFCHLDVSLRLWSSHSSSAPTHSSSTDTHMPASRRIRRLSVSVVSMLEVSRIRKEKADEYLTGYCDQLSSEAPVQLTHLKNYHPLNAPFPSTITAVTTSSSSSESKEEETDSTTTSSSSCSSPSPPRKVSISPSLRIASSSDVDPFFISNPDPTPWFSLYQSEFLRCMRFAAVDHIDCPAAVIYAFSTRDAFSHYDCDASKMMSADLDLASFFRRIDAAVDRSGTSHTLPLSFRTGAWNARRLHRVLLIVHDKHDSHLRPHVRNLFDSVKKRYATAKGGQFSCKLVHLNSVPLEEASSHKSSTDTGASTRSPPPASSSDMWSAHLRIHKDFPHTIELEKRLLKCRTPREKASFTRHTQYGYNVGRPDIVKGSPKHSWKKAAATDSGSSSLPMASGSAKTKRSPPAAVRRGTFLSEADTKVLRSLMHDIIVLGMIPRLEKRMRALYSSISAQRRGVSSALKRMFTSRKPRIDIQHRKLEKTKRKGRLKTSLSTASLSASVVGSSSGSVPQSAADIAKMELMLNLEECEDLPLYTGSDCIEFEIRELADTCMTLQQWPLALEHYKMVVADYKSDGCSRYLCGVYEMSALCHALMSKPVSAVSWMSLRSALSTDFEGGHRDLGKGKGPAVGGTTTSGSMSLAPSTLAPMSASALANRKEMEVLFDEAFKNYQMMDDISRSTRASMWCWISHYCLGHDFTSEMISKVLLRPSERETKHRSALLLEQAAFAYLRAGGNPAAAALATASTSSLGSSSESSGHGNGLSGAGAYVLDEHYRRRSAMIRKYAFHLILAAHLYKECDQKEHSVRCYSRAIMVYAQKGWSHVEDHINFNLGYLSHKLQRPANAVEFFLELLGDGRGSESRQKNFLDKFVGIVTRWNKNLSNDERKRLVKVLRELQHGGGVGTGKQVVGALLPKTEPFSVVVSKSPVSALLSNTVLFIPHLNIPRFDAQIRIVANSGDCTHLPTSCTSKVWTRDVSNANNGVLGFGGGNKDISFLAAATLDGSGFNASGGRFGTVGEVRKLDRVVLGESLCVDVLVTNPLKQELTVSNLCLQLRVLAAMGSTNAEAAEKAESKMRELSLLVYDDLFWCQPVVLTLAPESTKSVSLSVQLAHEILEGLAIEVTGLKWQVLNCIEGIHLFRSASASGKTRVALKQHVLSKGSKSVATLTADHRSIEDHIEEKLARIPLEFVVTKRQAKLEVVTSSVLPFPQCVYHCEVTPVVVSLVNCSDDLNACDLRLRVNLLKFVAVSVLPEELLLRLKKANAKRKLETGDCSTDIRDSDDEDEAVDELLAAWIQRDMKILRVKRDTEGRIEVPLSKPVAADCERSQKKWRKAKSMASETSGFIELLPRSEGVLAPSSMMHLLFWVRGAMPGQFVLEMLFGYNTSDSVESTQGSWVAPQRLAAIHKPLIVLAAANVSLFSRNKFSDATKHILGVNVENTMSDVLIHKGISDEVNTQDVIAFFDSKRRGQEPVRSPFAVGEAHNCDLFRNTIESKRLELTKKSVPHEDVDFRRDEQKLAAVKLRTVVCSSEHWRVNKLIAAIGEVSSLWHSTVHCALCPVADASDDCWLQTSDRRYVWSQQTVANESAADWLKTPHSFARSYRTLAALCHSQSPVISHFFELKHREWLRRLTLTSEAYGTTHKRPRNELHVVVCFELFESQTAAALDASSSSPTHDSRSAHLPAPRKETTGSAHPLDIGLPGLRQTAATRVASASVSSATSALPTSTTLLPRPSIDSGTLGRARRSSKEAQLVELAQRQLSALPKWFGSRRLAFDMIPEPFVFTQKADVSSSHCPVKVVMDFEPRVTLVVGGKQCTVDVHFTVVNISRCLHVSVLFETLPSTLHFDRKTRQFVDLETAHFQADYRWLAPETPTSVSKMAPCSAHTFSLTASFHRPGLFNVSRYRVTVKSFTENELELSESAKTGKAFVFPQQSFIVVSE